MASEGSLKTVGQIARESGLPTYSIAYAIASRRIQSATRVGIIRLFDEHQVAEILRSLAEIRSRRGERAQRQGGIDHVS
jgi:hypothetical protein